MLEKLTLHNFQRHQRLTLVLGPITTIVGGNGHGKSTLARALRWLAFNRPAGDHVLRHGQKSCRVRLHVDGRRLERAKGPNVYRLDGQTYRAFGTGVPEEVGQLLNLGPENFQAQIEAPYWFCLPPGQVSQQLNAVVDLSLIDRTLAALASQVRRARLALEIAQDRHQRAKEAAEQLAWTEVAHQRLHALEGHWQRAHKAQQAEREIRSLAEGCQQAQARCRQLATALRQLAPLLRRARLAAHEEQDLATMAVALRDLARAKERLCASRRRLGVVEKKLARYRACPLCGAALRS